jgi:hypothetical protein
MRGSWWDERRRLRTSEAIAYHEAGHVVVAYEFGWWVRRGGVRLGGWAHARLRHHPSGNTLLARVCVYMAGLLAEQRFHGVQWDLEEDFLEHIRAVRAGKGEGAVLDPSDFRAVALALLDDDPAIPLAEAPGALSYCRDYTNALLDDPRVWAGVERLAKKLARRRYLSPRAVRQVLGDAFFGSCGASIAGAEALLKKEQQLREAQQATAEYHAELARRASKDCAVAGAPASLASDAANHGQKTHGSASQS